MVLREVKASVGTIRIIYFKIQLLLTQPIN